MPVRDGAVAEDLEDLYENAPCGYISFGPDGRIVKVNLTFASWIGFSREDLLGRRLRDLLTVASAIFYETHFAPLLRMQGFFHEVALDLLTASGDKLAVLANAAEKRDRDGALLFTRLTIFRATERRRWERELVDAKSAAERGLRDEQLNSELREQFVAVLGHDLRNPLAGLQAGLNRIRRDGITEQTQVILDLMDQSIGRMEQLIRNVLDLAQSRLGGGLRLNIESGKSIEPVLVQVVDELRIAHPGRVIETMLDLDGPVDCDHARIGQLLSNLVGNALTHGAPEKRVGIAGHIRDGIFELWVSNGGDPIPAADLERLFQPFYRGKDPSKRQGLGLGLHIAWQIAQAHGGTIKVATDPLETLFTVRMPTRHLQQTP
jgi:sigma-B regulation protein RsbU (phosphoserine phosphatase)